MRLRLQFNMATKRNIVIVDDLMQKNYQYMLREPIGKNFHTDFKPELTPKQMLQLGVFGGKYMTDCTEEFPDDWFEGVKLCHDFHDPTLNFFGINASKSLEYWRVRGWIYPEDPRGWFQWYCRYFMGRRFNYDDKQIKRWKQMVRHIAQIKKNCPPGVLDCRKKQRQALLHWAYDSRLL